jgi:hypothetical protein
VELNLKAPLVDLATAVHAVARASPVATFDADFLKFNSVHIELALAARSHVG